MQKDIHKENMLKRYTPRNFRFEQIFEINKWKVKVYTITYNDEFNSEEILSNAINSLGDWLNKSKSLQLQTYNMAFLVIHEGKDGVWVLPHWWIGGEMLQKLTFYTRYEEPNKFELLPKEGSMACVWELSVICHERNAWIKHILKNADSPNFDGYLSDVIEGLI